MNGIIQEIQTERAAVAAAGRGTLCVFLDTRDDGLA